MSRTFGSIEKGSLKGSTLQLSAAAIGSGVLSLPYVLKETGFVLGLLLIVVGACASIISLRLIVSCSSQTHSNSYTHLVRKIFGSRADKALTVLILTGLSGSCITY
jgi:sodium-coupled neutral amino acid transporter 11